METEQIEVNELIARRVPPGDNWILTADETDTVHHSLTDALESWFGMSGEKVEFRLAPLDSKLYAIRYEQKQIEQPKPKKFNLYGE
jgi:hypothetical protein|tara:strand:- start:543 stop:800 length:258 start_codon:yes stop_codon:yes gene_type:complete